MVLETPTPSKTRLYWNAVFQDKKEREGEEEESVFFIDSDRLTHLLKEVFFSSSSSFSSSAGEGDPLEESKLPRKRGFQEKEKKREVCQNLLEALVSSAVYNTLLPNLPGRLKVPPKSRLRSLVELMCGCRHSHQARLEELLSSATTGSLQDKQFYT